MKKKMVMVFRSLGLFQYVGRYFKATNKIILKSSFLINWLHLNDVAFCRIKLILKVVIISLCYNLEVPPILYHIHYVTLYEGCISWYLYYRHEQCIKF